MKFNELCDQLGLDTISTGSVVGLAMDLTEKGVKDFGMRFGETEGYLKAPALIAAREGVGDELALGARGLAAKYGVPELAMEVKNMELPGYDPRGAFGMSLGYATSDRGGCHMRTYPIARRDRGRHPAAGHAGRQGDEGRLGQPGRGHDRRELQRREVRRHLVRLLGRHARADRADLQARLEARVHGG